MQNDRLRVHPPRRGKQRTVHGAHEMTVHDPLRQAGRAARVHDVEQVILAHADAVDRSLGTRAEQRRVVGVVGSRSVDHQHAVRRQPGKLITNRIEERRHRGLRDQAHRTRIAQQAGQAGSHQQRTQRHQDSADRGNGPVDLEQFPAVRKNRCHAIALAHTEPAQQMRALADAGAELAPGQALVLEDDGYLIRSKLSVMLDQVRKLQHVFPHPRFPQRARSTRQRQPIGTPARLSQRNKPAVYRPLGWPGARPLASARRGLARVGATQPGEPFNEQLRTAPATRQIFLRRTAKRGEQIPHRGVE